MADELPGLDLVPEAVVVVEDGRIVAVNDRARALLGVGPEAAGRRFDDEVTLQDDAGNRCGADIVARGRGGDRLAEQVLRVVLPDGRLRPVAVAARYHGERAVLSFRSAGRRERVDAARSDLVATVSHEIRSPLSSVKGFTSTLLKRWDRFSDEQKRTMLETINADADRVTRLLKELLEVSRIDAGRVQIAAQHVDVGSVVRSVVEKAGHRPEGQDRSISVETEVDLAAVLADPDKLEQILTNLIENALKYAPTGPVRVTARRQDGQALLTVADEGPGIPEDLQRTVFQKFGRGRDTRRSGTGLGLYITRGLAVAMDGEVWCESVEGSGATFHVKLPLADGG